MVTVLRRNGFRIVIYSNDHSPAHVHVFGDGEAKIELDPPRLLVVRGMTKAEARKALDIVDENRELLLREWRSHHG